MTSWAIKFQEWYAEQGPIIKGAVVLGGGAVAVVTGVAAAPVVGAIASVAGLGAAGGTLAGAAASSAGLAALGGGSLAAGGLGMAGGTAVVAAVSGAVGAAATTLLSKNVDFEGERTKKDYKRASNEAVKDGDIRFDEEA